MRVSAKLNNLRISPRKARLVARVIKGLDTEDALVQLRHLVKRSSPVMEKLLKNAIANAENNFGLDRNNLYVYDIQVGEGARLKRWLPRAYGRATQILKRTSKITLILEERVEGKGRKSKEEIAKERKKREEEKKKAERKLEEQRKKEETKKKEEIPFREKREEGGEREEKGKRKGWVRKLFQRKSG